LPYKDPSELRQNFEFITTEINTANSVYQALQILNSLMSFISRAHSPIDLLVHADLIANIFKYVFSMGIFDQVCVIVVQEDNLHIKWEGLKTLSYILACFRLKNQHFDGPLYVQSDQVKAYFTNAEFLNALLGLTFSSCLEVREQSLICVGFLVEISEESRDYFISQNIVTNYMNCLVNENIDIHLEMLGFVLASIASSLSTNYNYLMDNNLLVSDYL